MKRIDLKHCAIEPHNTNYINSNLHQIFYDWQKRIYFNSKTETLKFLIKLSKKLTKLVYELNYLYSLMFVEYRTLWNYLDGSNVYLKELDSYTQKCNEVIIYQFNRLFTDCTKPDGLFYTYNHIQKLFDELINFEKKFIEVRGSKKQMAELNNDKLILNRLNELKERFNKYFTIKDVTL